MPSRNNPNVPTKLKRKANRSKVQKRNAGKASSSASASASASSASSSSRISKTKNPRGTAPSSVLHPTAGPAAPLSGKKARKVERAVNHARRRALEAAMAKEGEVVMTDAPKMKTNVKPKRSGVRGGDGDDDDGGERMEVDDVS